MIAVAVVTLPHIALRLLRCRCVDYVCCRWWVPAFWCVAAVCGSGLHVHIHTLPFAHAPHARYTHPAHRALWILVRTFPPRCYTARTRWIAVPLPDYGLRCRCHCRCSAVVRITPFCPVYGLRTFVYAHAPRGIPGACRVDYAHATRRTDCWITQLRVDLRAHARYARLVTDCVTAHTVVATRTGRILECSLVSSDYGRWGGR